MKQTTQAENTVLALKAFDTLFNKRDYVVAERHWSPNHIQHGAHIEPSREDLLSLMKSIPPAREYEPGLIVAEGEFVIVHGRFSATAGRRTGSRQRHRAYGRRRACRALGCGPRRGSACGVRERPSHVRR
jgi:predicted SnoaL-like aldol condensation-catalyzing enzyme